MSESHPKCHGPEGHACQKPSGRACIDCGEPAGTLWGPHWCPDCDVKRLDGIGASLDKIASSFTSNDAPRRGMGSHQSTVMLTDTWLTPPHIIEALGPFDLDPCSAPDPKPWPTAEIHYTLPTDGLAEPWFGRVWLNPPYSREAVKWLRKLVEHGNGTALVFARTETSWFAETVWKAATAVLFLHGRLNFHFADGTRAPANAGAPSCLVAYGRDDSNLLAISGLEGTYVRLRP